MVILKRLKVISPVKEAIILWLIKMAFIISYIAKMTDLAKCIGNVELPVVNLMLDVMQELKQFIIKLLILLANIIIHLMILLSDNKKTLFDF